MKNVRRVLASLILALLLVSSWSASTRSKNAADTSNEQRGQTGAQAARATSTTGLAQKDLLPQPQAMNAEEKLVRDVYARLMRYQSAAIDETAAKTGIPAATTDFLTYQLRNIHWGPISELEQLPLSEIVTPRGGDVVELKPVHLSQVGGPPHAYYEASWAVVPLSNSTDKSVPSPSRFANFNRYTSYEVRVQLNGKQRIYRALAVYRLDDAARAASQRPAQIEILDNITVDMNGVYREESPRVRAPWITYVKTGLYRAIAKEINEARAAGKPLRPDDAAIGYLPGDDVVMLMPIDGGGGGDDGGGDGGGGTPPPNCLPSVTVSEVGFTGDYMITKWSDGTQIDSPDGSSPTWKATSNPNLPAAYSKEARITMFAKFAISPSATSTAAKIRVKNGTTVLATKDVTLSGSTLSVTGITAGSAIEKTIKTTAPTFAWEISYDGGTSWASIGTSGPHILHWTNAAPLIEPFKDDDGFTYSALYDLALEKACGYAAGAVTTTGAVDIGAVIGNINTGVDTDTNYNPANSIHSLHPLSAYETTAGIQCSDEANLLRGLLRSIGIDGTVLYIWAGPDASTLRRFTVASTGATNPSFRIIRAAHDSAVVNPHFKFHAVVSTNSKWYDPSYGLIYTSLSFDETAFNSTPQQVHSSFWSSELLSSYVCPH